MKTEKIIIGMVMIFIGTLAILVTTPKEGLEVLHHTAIVAIIILGAYFNWTAIKE